MNNNSRKIRIITIIMLLSLLTTLFSACAASAVSADYFTAEMPTVESVVGYNVDDVAYETETIQTLADTADESDSVVKLSETGDVVYFAGGTGVVGDPYKIATAAQLAFLAQIINTADTGDAVDVSDDSESNTVAIATLRTAYYVLTSDIDLNSGYTFEFEADTGLIAISKDSSIVAYQGTGIAGDDSGTNSAFDSTASEVDKYYSYSEIYEEISDIADYSLPNSWTAIGTSSNQFQGTFDGDGKEISGLYINTTSNNQGLFGYVGSGGIITNLGVSGSVTGGQYVGGVVGYNSGTVSNCYNTGSVSGTYYVGGVVGYNYGVTVSNCYNTGAVKGTDDNVGGVVGYNDTGAVSNCYNTGNVTGDSNSGGVVGTSQGSGATVKNCYNTGNVTGKSNVGGIVGSNYSTSTVSNCYAFEGVAVTSSTSTKTLADGGALISFGSATSDVTTFNSNGDVTLTDDYVSYKTLVSALNAYVDAENTDDDTALMYWKESGDSYAVNSAPIVLTTTVPPAELVTSFVDGYGGEVTILSDGSATYTYDGNKYTGSTDSSYPNGADETWEAHIDKMLDTWTAVTSETDLSGTTTGGSYYLASDIETTSTITIGDSTGSTPYTVNLNLNGHVIEYNYDSTNASVITVSSGATLNLYDAEITDESTTTVIDDPTDSVSETITITGGLITGGTGTTDDTLTCGGGVCVYASGTFNMYGGTIAGNSVKNGGGVYVYVNGAFNMYGGLISGNTTTTYTGAGVWSNGRFTMYGGEISSNVGSKGAGVYVPSGTFNMYGGTIAGNSATESGGGVYNEGTFSVSGAPVISDNLRGTTTNNVYLPSGEEIAIDGELTSDADIGVTMADGTGVFTNAYSADYSAYFTADGAYRVVATGSSGNYTLSLANWATVSGTNIYANGMEMLIVDAGNDESYIYFGYDGDGDYTTPANYEYTFAESGSEEGDFVVTEYDSTTPYDLSDYTIYGGSNSDFTGDTRVTITGGSIGSAFSGNENGSAVGDANLDINLASNLTISGVLGTSTVGEGITSFVAGDFQINYLASAKSTIAYFDIDVMILSASNFTNSDSDSDYSFIKEAAVEAEEASDENNNTAVDEENGFIVFAKDFSTVEITLSESNTTYTGGTIDAPSITSVKFGTSDATYTATDFATIKDAGTYSTTLTGTGEFYGTKTVDFTVDQETVDVSWSTGTYTYTGSELTAPTATATCGTESVNLTVTLSGETEFINAGDYTFTATLPVTGYENYVLNTTAPEEGEPNTSSTQSVTITKKDIAITWIEATSYVYSGSAIAPTASTDDIVDTDSDVTITVEISGYNLSGDGTAINVGSYTATASISGDTNGNYAIATDSDASAKEKTFTITAKPVTFTWTSDSSFEYDGDSHGDDVTATVVGGEDGDEFTLEYSTVGDAINVTNDGFTKTVTALGNDNYMIEENETTDVSGWYKIDQKAITITAINQTIEYGESISENVSDYSVATLIGDHAISEITLTASGTDATSSGTITPSAATILNGSADVTANYLITYAEGVLTITQVAQNIEYEVATISKVVGNDNFTNELSETTVDGGISYESDAEGVATVDSNGEVTIVGAGTATIKATAAATTNYSEYSASYELTVYAAPVVSTGTDDSGDSGDSGDSDASAPTITNGNDVTIALGSSIELTVQSQEAIADDADSSDEKTAQVAIKESATAVSNVEYLDITLSKVGDATETVSDATVVMEIAYPYVTSGKTGITVYRYHDYGGDTGAVTESFTALEERPTSDYVDGTYYCDTESDTIYIYTQYFSTYAIGYDIIQTSSSSTSTSTSSSSSSSSSSVALDQSAPEIEADGSEVTITDKNLLAVYVNGEKYEVDGDTFEIDLESLGDGEYEIVAWDRYGRTTTQAFTISGTEVESGDVVESETEVETPAETETPTATTTPTPAETEDASSTFPWIWIILGVVAIGAVGYVVYKKKK